MATYIVLNAAVMAIIAGALWRWRLALNPHIIGVVLGIMLLLTAIFDSFIIMVDIVAYDVSKLLGVYIGAAPLEDFAYAIVAAILAPLIWIKLKDRT